MTNSKKEEFEKRKANLKRIRDEFLRFHKMLMDWDRSVYEREFGAVSSGKFLELLLGNPRFSWLRTISTLIVRIDEAFDLDDGLSKDMLDGFYEEIGNLFDESDEYHEFKTRLEAALVKNPEIVSLRDSIVEDLELQTSG